MGIVIAVVSGKGGTGKTTFTALVGSALAKQGFRTLVLDCDIGLRNLDLALGLSDRAAMDFTDVASHRCTLDDAAVSHPDCPDLYLLTAPVNPADAVFPKEEMSSVLQEIRSRFDYCLVDAAAGLGEAFRLATCFADRVIVVTGTDATSLRDAQRAVMELRRFPQGNVHLVVNRVKRKLLLALHHTLDDAIDTAGLPLIGIIPDDISVPLALGKGCVGLSKRKTLAQRAAANIAKRICGEKVPLMKL